MTGSRSRNNALCKESQPYLQIKELAVSAVDDLGSQVGPCHVDYIDLVREKKAQVNTGSETQATHGSRSTRIFNGNPALGAVGLQLCKTQPVMHTRTCVTAAQPSTSGSQQADSKVM